MEVRISVDGRDADFEALWEWLRSEPDIRGRLRLGSLPTPEGTMGSSTEVVVQAAAAMAGAGALWAALSRSLAVWLTQRRSDITVTVTGPDGRKVSLNAKRVTDPENLLREVLNVPVQAATEPVEQ
ncbi:hypothetical protein ACFP2T_10530 [Plantactinospora solaniradicis]|uniref:Uncharacterized protein n=1 Tax=Plantactinospora solaniradicis TaxID=1723736 RepID=A0ABW1K622_9ACTN